MIDRSSEIQEIPKGRFDGFISYSHAADGLLAPRLQAALQSFAKPWWKRRALRLFRDEASLSANPHLWSSITEALGASEWFVLLTSPEAANSEWVEREVAWWLEHKDPNRILPVLTAGELVWDETSGVLAPTSAVPRNLLGAFREEPRWVDLRSLDTETELDLRNSRFRSAVADLASTMRGVPKDDLESEEVRQHRRTVRTAWAAASALLLLAAASVTGGVIALDQRNEAAHQARVAEARGLAAQAVALTPTRLDLALLLAVEGFNTHDSLQTRAGLLHALNGAQHLVRFHPALGSPQGFHSANGRVAVLDGTQIRVWDTETWTEVAPPIVPSGGAPFGFLSGDGSRVVAMSEGEALVWDSATGQQVGRAVSVEGGTDVSTDLDIDRSGQMLALSKLDDPFLDVRVFRIEDGELLGRFDLGQEPAMSFGHGTFSPDGSLLLLVQNDKAAIFDVQSKEAVVPVVTLDWVNEAAVFSPNGDLAALFSLIPGEIHVVDATTLEPVFPPLRPTSGGRIYGLEFSPNGQRLAAYTDDGAATVFNMADGSVTTTLKGPGGFAAGFGWLDSDRLMLGTDTGVTEWDLNLVSVIGESQFTESYFAWPDVDYARGSKLVTAEGTLYYEAEGQEGTLDLGIECNRINASQTAPLVALGCTDGEVQFVRVVDVASGETQFETESTPVVNFGGWGLEFSPDGSQLAVFSGLAVEILDSRTGELLMPPRQFDVFGLNAVAWDPTGNRLLIGGQEGNVIFFDTDHDKETARLTLEPAAIAVYDFVVHPDGRRMYASTEAGRVWVVDLETASIDGEPLEASGTQLQEVALSPDGRFVGAASRDGALRIWETDTRRSVGPALVGHGVVGRGVEWGPEGPVSIGINGSEPDGLAYFNIVEWNLDPTNMVAVACDLVGRNLTEAEWAEYVPDTEYRATCLGESTS